MARWAIIFFIVALIAAVFGFGGIAGEAAWIGQVLLFVFLVHLDIAEQGKVVAGFDASKMRLQISHQ